MFDNEHVFEGDHLHQDTYTGKLHHNKNNTDKAYNCAIELIFGKRTPDHIVHT